MQPFAYSPQSLPDGQILLRSDTLRLILDPVAGGKVRSLVSLPTGREFFFQDTRYGHTETDYSRHDISGMDECFPTVAPCSFDDGPRRGQHAGDHGLLWNKAWSVEFSVDGVLCKVEIPELECVFERACRLSASNEVMLEYRISYGGAIALPFVYSAHPLLSGSPQSQLLLPKSADNPYVEAAWGWPQHPAKRRHDNKMLRNYLSESAFDPSRNACLKLFLPNVAEGRAGLRHRDSGETLIIEFDRSVLPHLGVLIYEGYAPSPDSGFANTLFFALEPTTGVGDDLATCRATDSLSHLQPDGELRFWIKLRVEVAKAP